MVSSRMPRTTWKRILATDDHENPGSAVVKKRGGGLVYSSHGGRMCPSCGRPAEKCTCTQENPRGERGDGFVRVKREVKGRRGKAVTTISGVPLPDDKLRALAGELKRRCATGGSVKQGVIEIQGDHRDQLLEVLEERGYSVKLAGG